MKKKYKILIYMIILFVSLMLISTAVLATDPLQNPGDWKPSVSDPGSGTIKLANIVVGVIQTVGTYVSVIVLVIMGIKYMMGSVEEKAEYKKTMVPYLIGAVLVFAGVNIVQLLYNVGKTL